MLDTPIIPGCTSYCPPPKHLADDFITPVVAYAQHCEDMYFQALPGNIRARDLPIALSERLRMGAVQLPGLSLDPPNDTGSSDRCGPEHNDTSCPDEQCCSSAGYCGRSPEHCRVPDSCQPKFGKCASDMLPKALRLIPGPWKQRSMWFKETPVAYNTIIDKCTQNGTMAITFDDGPSNNTQAILDVLRQHKAKATFFLSGNTNARYAIDENVPWLRVIRQMRKEGHQVGSHTWSHPHLDRLSQPDRLQEMLFNDIAIFSILQASPTYMRPPYLECSSTCMDDMTSLGYHVIGFEIDTHDTETFSLKEMKSFVDDALAKKAPGENAQFILHDLSDNANVIPLTQYILEKTSNLKAVTMAECLGDHPEYVYYKCPPDPLLATVIGTWSAFAAIVAALTVYWIYLCAKKDD